MSFKRDYSVIAEHVSTSCQYALTDQGSGRCRLRNDAFVHLGIRIGWIIVLQTANNELYLLTAWPDSMKELDDVDVGESLSPRIYYNGSVRVQTNRHTVSMTLKQPISNLSKIIEVHPPKICRSIEILDHPNILIAAELSRLPVTSNAIINNHAQSTRKGGGIQVGNVIGCSIGIISNDTIILNNRIKSSDASSKQPSSSIISASSSIFAVNEIMRRVVEPFLKNPVNLSILMSGLLLVGPPGTGKTYAVKAVKEFCTGRCSIRIVDVLIPTLLSSDDPKTYLDNITKAEFSFRAHHPKRDTLQQSTPSVSLSSPLIRQSSSTMSQPSSASKPFSFKDMDFNSPSSSSSISTPTKTPIKSPATSHNNISSTTLPEIVFIVLDEIDALGVGSTQQNQQSEKQVMIKHILCDWFDRINAYHHDHDNHIDVHQHHKFYCIIGTSNRSQDIDQTLHRCGRFEAEIQVLTSKHDRMRLIMDQLRRCDFLHDTAIDYHVLAHTISEHTGGYVAADLISLVDEVKRYVQLQSSSYKHDRHDDVMVIFRKAMMNIAPSCLRGVTIDTPNLSYDDVIGCEEAKKALRRILSFTDASKATLREHFHINHLGGALLFGPPGNSKTRLIMAAAASHGLPVIALSSADVYSPYVGDAEAEIRKVFTIARQGSPCILFFDELDALVTNRSDTSSSSSSSNVESRVLATLLNEMDGIGSSSSMNEVIVMAATNRIDCIDAALLRKGRFQHLVHVPLPSFVELTLLLEYFAQKLHLQRDWRSLVSSLYKGQSGAEVENICREEKLKELEIYSSIVHSPVGIT